MPPQEFQTGRTWGGASEDIILTGYSVVDAEGGVLRFFFVQAGSSVVEAPAYRLVVFDASGRRYLPTRSRGGGLKNRETEVSDALFSLDPKVLAPDKVAYIAVERVKPRSR
jgi:hypothetical protein